MSVADLDRARLTAARLWVISRPPPRSTPSARPRNQPYLSRALFALRPVACDHVARMTVDEGWRLYVNPDWLAATDIPEIGRELTHLVWHLLATHAARARRSGVSTGSARRWCRAGDISIAWYTDGADLRPQQIPPPNHQGHDGEQTTEELFAGLGAAGFADDPDSGPDPPALDECGSGADGLPRDYEVPAGDIDLPALTAVETGHIRRQVAVAFQTSNAARGTGAGAIERWARHLLEPTMPWPQLLAGAVRRALATTAGHGDYTYRRPSRRAASVPDILLPSQHRPVPELAIVIDTSASMSELMISRALTELDNIVASLRVAAHGIIAVSVDDAAYHLRRVRRAADVDVIGGGGTDMTIGIAAVARERPRPEIVVVFTDGHTPWPAGPVPGMTVIAALLAQSRHDLPETPEWVVRVECVDETET
ncbi:MAG: VWA-like domain-containing protein [Gordonia sp. (in: high G+C Gram-positive bacteria)]